MKTLRYRLAETEDINVPYKIIDTTKSSKVICLVIDKDDGEYIEWLLNVADTAIGSKIINKT